MNDRDKFAAAALTGLLGGMVPPYRSDDNEAYAQSAWTLADAMLAARGTTDHDAAPAATASEAEKQAVGRRAETIAGEAGTGDTRAAEPVAWAAYDSESDAEPIVLCFKESRARDEVRGVAGSRVVPLYAAAAPPAPSVTLTAAEREVLRECADIAWAQLLSAEEGGDEATIARWTRRNVLLRGLLSRAAKEGER